MTIELTKQQVEIVATCLADAMDELSKQIRKKYRENRRDYAHILQKEHADYCEILKKITDSLTDKKQ